MSAASGNAKPRELSQALIGISAIFQKEGLGGLIRFACEESQDCFEEVSATKGVSGEVQPMLDAWFKYLRISETRWSFCPDTAVEPFQS